MNGQRYGIQYNEILFNCKKKNEILPSATSWMGLEGIMISDINQTQKDKYCISSLICGIQKNKTSEYKQNKRKWNT